MRYAVIVTSKEGTRLVSSSAGTYWEKRFFRHTWTIEETEAEALAVAAKMGGYVVPEDKRFEHVGWV